jgi:autotransporter-associated beta strand protein
MRVETSPRFHFVSTWLACWLVLAITNASAQWIGGKSSSGDSAATHSYLRTANWTNGQVLGTFDATLTGNLTLYFSHDYTPAGDFNLYHGGNFDLTLLGGGRSSDSGTVPAASHTLFLNGNLNVDSAVEEVDVNLGSTSATAGLTVNLNGATRTINVGDRTFLHLENGVAGNGGILKEGRGYLYLEAAGTYDGTTTIKNGIVLIQNNQALGSTTSGTVVDATGTGSNASLYLSSTSDLTITGEPLFLHGQGSAINSGALYSTNSRNTWAGPITIGNLPLVADNTRIGSSLGTTTSSTPTGSQRGFLTLTGNIELSPEAADQLVLQGDNSGLISGNISGGSQLTKGIWGYGTWALSGTNTYTGVTNVTNGNLQFVKRVSLYNADTSKWNTTNIKVNSSGGLIFNLGGVGEFSEAEFQSLSDTLVTAADTRIGIDSTNAPGGVYNYATPIGNGASTSRGFVKRGTGSLTLSGNNTYSGTTHVEEGTLILTGPNSTSGLMNINGGTLNLRHSNALGGTTNGVVLTRGPLNSTSQLQLEGGITITGEKLTVTNVLSRGDDIVSISGNNTWTGDLELNGATRVITPAGKLTVSGNVAATAAGAALWLTGNGTTEFSGNLSGLLNVNAGYDNGISSAPPTVILSGVSNYTGYTSISAGTLIINNNAPSAAAGALGNTNSFVNVSVYDSADPVNILISGPYTVGRTFDISDYSGPLGGPVTTPGMITIGGNTASTATISGNIRADRATTITQSAGGTLVLRGGLFTSASNISPITIGGAGKVVVENLAFSLQGTNKLTVDTAASLILNTNFLVDNNAQVIVNGLIGGSGEIQFGPTKIGATGIIAPGNSAGTLTFDDLTLDPNSTLRFELGAPGTIGGTVNDFIDLNGTLVLDGQLDVSALPGFRAGTYTLMQHFSTFTNNGLNVRSMPLGFVGTISLTSTNVNLVVTVVPIPEPGTWALGAAGLVGWGLIRGQSARRNTIRARSL